MSENNLMHLEKLIAQRDRRQISALPIAEEEMCARYGALYSGAVNDVLREFALVDQALPHDILPLTMEMKTVGFAFCIKSCKDPTITGEMDTRAKMLDAMPENCVCVWDTGGESEAAHWGEVMTAAAKARGARGAVIDGGVRDTLQVLGQHFPVFCKYRTSNGSLSRCKIVGFQVPVQIGKVIIYPGDLIFGDVDGALAVPRALAFDVLKRAEEICQKEKGIRSWVETGMKAGEVVGKGGYF